MNTEMTHSPPVLERATEDGTPMVKEHLFDTVQRGKSCDHDISDLLHLEQTQRLLDSFCQVAGIAAAVIDLDGKILAGSNWQRICTDFHRVNERTCARCIESDTDLADQMRAQPNYSLYRCRNGLMDAASPILIDGKHVANVFIGQFLLESPNTEFFEKQALEFNFNEEAYLSALMDVPIVQEERLPVLLNFLTTCAEVLASMGLDRLNMLAMNEELHQHREDLEKIVTARTEQLETANQRLHQSNQELEQFAYVASHDLQEPLRMVSSYTQLLERRYKDQLDQDAHDFIHFAVDGATRMQQLINDLLSFSRITTRGKPFQFTESGDSLEKALYNLSSRIEEASALVTSDRMPTVVADASQLTLVFQNIIGNAVKYCIAEPPLIHISARESDEEWVLSVRDNGIGIAPEYHDRIFVIFQRLHSKREYSGTGIGLAISKRIIERHGGRIWVESADNKGSTFFFTIPKEKKGNSNER